MIQDVAVHCGGRSRRRNLGVEVATQPYTGRFTSNGLRLSAYCFRLSVDRRAPVRHAAISVRVSPPLPSPSLSTYVVGEGLRFYGNVVSLHLITRPTPLLAAQRCHVRKHLSRPRGMPFASRQ